MKYIFTFIFIKFFFGLVAQENNFTDIDSFLIDYPKGLCYENKNKLYNWKTTPDSVFIEVFNREGEIITETNNIDVSTISLFYKKDSLGIKKPIIKAGTYFVLITIYFENKKYFLSHYLIAWSTCCG